MNSKKSRCDPSGAVLMPVIFWYRLQREILRYMAVCALRASHTTKQTKRHAREIWRTMGDSMRESLPRQHGNTTRGSPTGARYRGSPPPARGAESRESRQSRQSRQSWKVGRKSKVARKSKSRKSGNLL